MLAAGVREQKTATASGRNGAEQKRTAQNSRPPSTQNIHQQRQHSSLSVFSFVRGFVLFSLIAKRDFVEETKKQKQIPDFANNFKSFPPTRGHILYLLLDL